MPQLQSIDFIEQPCYFKIFIHDRYGREIKVSTLDVRYTIEDYGGGDNLTYIDRNVDSTGGICVWPEDLVKIEITDGGNCIADLLINIDNDNYLSGDDIIVVSDYLNAVDVLPGNPYNYMRWFLASGSVSYPFNGVPPTNYNDRSIECTGCKIMDEYMANPYLMNGVKYKPVVTPCDPTSFFFNSDQGVDASGITALRLDVIDCNFNTVQTDVGLMKTISVNGAFVRFYSENIRVSGLSDCGTYMFVVYDPGANNAVAISNPWMFLEDEEKINDLTSLLEYRSSQDMYYFNYVDLPNYKNQIRVHLHAMGWTSEGNTETYQEETTGIVRNYFSTTNKFHEVRTYYFDDAAHEATVVMNEHDKIEINKISYTVKTKHQKENDPQRNTHNGTFEVYEDRFARVNKNC